MSMKKVCIVHNIQVAFLLLVLPFHNHYNDCDDNEQKNNSCNHSYYSAGVAAFICTGCWLCCCCCDGMFNVYLNVIPYILEFIYLYNISNI